MLDYVRYYNLEEYLQSDVNRHFAADGSIGAFDFFSIIIWKANRAKTQIARKLQRMDREQRTDLEAIVRELTSALSKVTSAEARLRMLMEDWKFALPMASAILTVLWPDDFTVYDVRVCEQLNDFHGLGSLTRFASVWTAYGQYREAVQAAVPGDLSLRDKDRFLWAKSSACQLERDIVHAFVRDGA
ncbi:MAG: hypothetical protein IPP90_12540 [Gemmatimonadaceae bacterium]|nr:hypothetical protein [Gemmatimonadaceae bacterium]